MSVQMGLFAAPASSPERGGSERVQRSERPNFRRLGDVICSWCHGPREDKPRGGHGRYCSDRCRGEAYRAPKKERQRKHGEARKLMGLATADENNRESRETAQKLALRYLATHHVAIISDIREFAQEQGVELDWSKPWTANVFRPPWFEATGVRRKVEHERGNARKVNEYRLTAAGRAALESGDDPKRSRRRDWHDGEI